MIDWTEQEEQEMIARAKAGDPRANYELSLWALERSEEEPDEIRWNRLAAKCLVKAAQAGYGPAQERMADLLAKNAAPAQSTARKAPAEPAADEQEETPAPVVPISGARRGSRHAAARTERPRQTTTARRPAPEPVLPEEDEDVYDDDAEAYDEDEDSYDGEDRPARRKRPAAGKGRLPFSEWGEAQWRRMELICIGVCAVLIIAILIMFITGRRSGGGQQIDPTVPQAGEVTQATPTPEAEPYPDDSVKRDIMASDIEVQPADLDYVKAPTTATVTVGTGNKTLRLRSGPNTNYKQLAQMPDGSTVDVFAKKDDWDLVLYQGDDGPLYGWASESYLITTSGSVG